MTPRHLKSTAVLLIALCTVTAPIAAQITKKVQPNSVQRNSARWWMNQAFIESKDIEDVEAADKALVLISNAQTLIDDDAGAIRTQATIQDLETKASAQLFTAVWLAEKKKTDKAMKLTATIEQDYFKLAAYCSIVTHQAQANAFDEARKTLTEAMAIIEKTTDQTELARMRPRLAEAQAHVGDATGLAATLVRLGQEEAQKCQVELALAQVKLKDFDNAILSVRQIQNAEQRSRVFQSLIDTLLAMKDVEGAISISQSAENIDFEGQMLAAVALHHTRENQMELVGPVLSRIRHTDQKDHAIRNVALVLLERKRFDEAINMVKQMTGPMQKADTYQLLGNELIEVKRNTQARAALNLSERFAGLIRDRRQRAIVYAGVALGRHRINDRNGAKSAFNLARLAAYGIKDHNAKLEAYLQVAARHAGTSNRIETEKAFERARVHAMKSSEPQTIVDQLARVARTQVTAGDFKGVAKTLDLLMRYIGNLKVEGAKSPAYSQAAVLALQAEDSNAARRAIDLAMTESKALAPEQRLPFYRRLATNIGQYGDLKELVKWVNDQKDPLIRTSIFQAGGLGVLFRTKPELKRQASSGVR